MIKFHYSESKLNDLDYSDDKNVQYLIFVFGQINGFSFYILNSLDCW